MTPQERRLWWQLRDINRRLGTNFRRQAPLGSYVVDFADLGRRLVIEVDGSQHGEAAGLALDAARDGWLSEQGFRVLRLWNSDVSRNMEGVMQTVLDALGIDGAGPPHHPSGQCPDPTRGAGGVPVGQGRTP